MTFNDQIKELMKCADGSRLGERDIFPTQKKSFLSEDVKGKLLAQWSAAGRDAATVYAKLDEDSGNSYYVTGWDGKDSYVGFEAGKGFGYLPATRLESAKLDEAWDASTPLSHVRRDLSEMEQSEINDLLATLKRCVTKRSKDRRKNEVKNFIKKFEKMMAKEDAKEKAPVAESYRNEVDRAVRGFPTPQERKPLRSALRNQGKAK